MKNTALNSAPNWKKFAALPKELRDFLERDPAAWTAEERTKAERNFFFERNAELTALYRALDKDQAALAALPACALPIMKELIGKDARTKKDLSSRAILHTCGQSRERPGVGRFARTETIGRPARDPAARLGIASIECRCLFAIDAARGELLLPSIPERANRR